MKIAHLVAVIGTALAAAFAAPAQATPFTPVTVSNVQVNWGQGQGVSASTGGIYYAGPITFTIGGNALTVWCDDFANEVYIGSANNYFQTDAEGANAYLTNPALTPAQQTKLIKQIAGLAYQGTMLAAPNGLNPTLGAQYQMAIWELQTASLLGTDNLFQTGVDQLKSQALGFYSDMLQANYTYGQLVSPGCGQDPASLTYTSRCQTQGQIFVSYDPTRKKVPEPMTLSLVAAGVAGAAALRRRKKGAAKA